MLISALFESPQDDVSDAKTTLAAFHAISKLTASTEPGFEIEMSGDRHFYGFDLKSLVKQFPCLANTILLLSVRQPNTAGVSGSVMNFKEPMQGFHHAIVLYGLRSFDESAISSFVNSTAFLATFRHEFLHILDIARTNGAITDNRDLDPRNNRAGYFNDPAEFNAFWHDLSRPFLEIGEQEPEEAREYAEGFYGFTGDPRSDIAKILKPTGLNKQFLNHLTPDRRKALLRRLYKLHADYIAPAFR